MDHHKTVHLLTTLSGGVDPVTGQPLPADHLCQHPDVVRALFHALRLIEGVPAPTPLEPAPAPAAESAAEIGPEAAAPAPRKRRRESPGNAGKPWSADEDTRLAAGFDAGRDPASLAADLGRSPFAVEVRLAKLGRLPAPERTRYAFSTATASVPSAAGEPARPYLALAA